MSKTADRIRKFNRPFCSAVVLAAGSSTRFGGEDKLLAGLGGIPVLARTLLVLQQCECIHEIVVVTRADKLEETAKLCRDYAVNKVSRVVVGGKERAQSSLAGVCSIDGRARLVAIHDGDRPLITPQLVEETVHTAALHKAAAPSVALRDTVKVARGGLVEMTPERSTLTAVQTPQVFIPELISAALTDAMKSGVAITDDCSAAERLHIPVRLCAGSEENIKITTPLDIKLAEAILAARAGGAAQ